MERENFWIHPALLDSCLQVLAGIALPEHKSGAGRKMDLPSRGCGESALCGKAGPASYTATHRFATKAISGAEFLGSGYSLAWRGMAALSRELLGFRAKLVSPDTERDGRDNPDDLLYDISWIEKAAAPENPDNRYAQPISRGSHRRQDHAKAWATSLQCACNRRENIASSPSPENAQSLLPSLGNVNVIYLASLDIYSPDHHADAILGAQKQWIGTFRLIQFLLKISHEGKTKFVDRDARSAVGWTATCPRRSSIAQTPLLGLAKSVDLEHPELAFTRIDLNPQAGAEEIGLSRLRNCRSPSNGARSRIPKRNAIRGAPGPAGEQSVEWRAHGNSGNRFVSHGNVAAREAGKSPFAARHQTSGSIKPGRG